MNESIYIDRVIVEQLDLGDLQPGDLQELIASNLSAQIAQTGGRQQKAANDSGSAAGVNALGNAIANRIRTEISDHGGLG